jgi:bla regulator protein BlaR1
LFRPVLLLPEGIESRLTPAPFRAILVHEFCHVQRGDHLAAAFHMAVETLLWFHPAIWIIGARLFEERERACDEEVLLRGNKPEDYASGILKVCRSYLESSLPCAPAITGADLNRRMLPSSR